MKNKIISTPKDIFENEKQNPNEWRKLLHELYHENWIWYSISDFNEDSNNPLLKKLKLTPRSLNKSMYFLKEHELIKIDGKDNQVFLTPKGFEIAREEQNHKLNASLQTVIIYLTTIIAITTAFELFNNLGIISVWTLFLSYLVVGTTLIVLFYFIIFRRLTR